MKSNRIGTTYHINQSDVDKEARGHGEHPLGHVLGLPESNAKDHANEAQDTSQQVVVDGRFHRHARLYENGKVAQLVRQFMTENGQRGREATGKILGKGGANGHAISEVVQAIAHDNHPGHGTKGFRRRMNVPVAVTVSVVGRFVLSQDDSDMIILVFRIVCSIHRIAIQIRDNGVVVLALSWLVLLVAIVLVIVVVVVVVHLHTVGVQGGEQRFGSGGHVVGSLVIVSQAIGSIAASARRRGGSLHSSRQVHPLALLVVHCDLVIAVGIRAVLLLADLVPRHRVVDGGVRIAHHLRTRWLLRLLLLHTLSPLGDHGERVLCRVEENDAAQAAQSLHDHAPFILASQRLSN